MTKLLVFNAVSLDGYFTGENGDLSWAHGDPNDAEWNDYVAGNASGEGALVLGRKTYEMMAAFWPTPAAFEMMPSVAEHMGATTKLVFSRTMTEAPWRNTTILSGDPAEEIRRIKDEGGADMTVLGSGTIVARLAAAGLVDEYQFVVRPVVLGAGRTMFDGRVDLRRADSRTFRNGSVVLTYVPA